MNQILFFNHLDMLRDVDMIAIGEYVWVYSWTQLLGIGIEVLGGLFMGIEGLRIYRWRKLPLSCPLQSCCSLHTTATSKPKFHASSLWGGVFGHSWNDRMGIGTWNRRLELGIDHRGVGSVHGHRIDGDRRPYMFLLMSPKLKGIIFLVYGCAMAGPGFLYGWWEQWPSQEIK